LLLIGKCGGSRLKPVVLVSVINQIEGLIITLGDGQKQANIAADLWQNSNFPRQVE